MRALEQVIAEARLLASDPLTTYPVGLSRQRRADLIAKALASNGYPETETDRIRLSLVPLLFQEANYDDIGWMIQEADLRQLRQFFELDHLVQTGGLSRAEASPEAFARYVKGAYRAIDGRRAP